MREEDPSIDYQSRLYRALDRLKPYAPERVRDLMDRREALWSTIIASPVDGFALPAQKIDVDLVDGAAKLEDGPSAKVWATYVIARAVEGYEALIGKSAAAGRYELARRALERVKQLRLVSVRAKALTTDQIAMTLENERVTHPDGTHWTVYDVDRLETDHAYMTQVQPPATPLPVLETADGRRVLGAVRERPKSTSNEIVDLCKPMRRERTLKVLRELLDAELVTYAPGPNRRRAYVVSGSSPVFFD